MVHEQFGAPAIIKGVATYENAVSKSLLTGQQEFPTTDWNSYSKRCGAIARKIGVVPLWKKNGDRIITTMLQVRIKLHGIALFNHSGHIYRMNVDTFRFRIITLSNTRRPVNMCPHKNRKNRITLSLDACWSVPNVLIPHR